MLSHWIVAIIKDVAKTELEGKNAKLLDALWDLINCAFKTWKTEHGDKHPKIISGLLGPDREIKFEDAEAWECAGLANPSRLSLALMLISQDNPDFRKLLEIVEVNTVLALLIDKEPDSYTNDDMFIAYGILVRGQSEKQGGLFALRANLHHLQAGIKQKKNLARGNPVASKNKSIKADEHHELWKSWAKDTWRVHPYWTVEQVAEHVLDIATNEGHKMANKKPYQVGTIIKVITGIRQSLKAK